MNKVIEKSAFDWSRDKSNHVVLARGVGAIAMLSHKVNYRGDIISTGSTRCVWDNLRSKSDTRFLKKRVWLG